MLLDILISACLVLGGIFGAVGSWGLVRLEGTMQRLHAPTKATTLGVGGVLIASMLHLALKGAAPSWHELLITLFLLLTAPVTAQFIAQAFLRLHVDESALPPSGRPVGWSIYHDAPSDGPRATPHVAEEAPDRR